MPSWNELLSEIDSVATDRQGQLLLEKLQKALNDVSGLRGGRNVVFYASAFLQKPQAPPARLQITYEDINGFMSVMYGMNWDKNLTLILHTPGGIGSATESIVSYLNQKFNDIEVIVPFIAMSAGTMISLASKRIIMGRQSQLGPIDPQIPVGGGRYVSAQLILEQFSEAKNEILENERTAHYWAPILQSMGPALVKEASNALEYSEKLVADWLKKGMFCDHQNPEKIAVKTAKYFRDASIHLDHGRRIDRESARSQEIVIEDLEDNQELQESILTAYHLITIAFEKSPGAKVIESNHNRRWIKNWLPIPQKS